MRHQMPLSSLTKKAASVVARERESIGYFEANRVEIAPPFSSPICRKHAITRRSWTATCREVAMGRVVGPVPLEHARWVRISPLGVILKPHQPGRWRLIVDLSSPKGSSINDAIRPEWCSTRYIRVEDAVRRCLQLILSLF